MFDWFEYLKKGLSRQLPADHYNKTVRYGRLRDNIKYLFPSVKSNWRIGLLSAVLMLLSSLLLFPQPMITKYLIDDVLIKKQVELILPVVGLLAAVGLGHYLFNMLKSYYQMRLSQEVIFDIQKNMIKKGL